MYLNYPCRSAQSCCNDMLDMDNCCNLGRRNQSMIDCCPPRRRLQDFRVFESKPRAPKCKGLAHTLAEAKQQAKMMAAAAAIAQYQNLCSNSKINTTTNPRNGYVSKSASKFMSQQQQQAASKQSPYQTTHHSPSPTAQQYLNSSSNQSSLKSQDSNQSGCQAGSTSQCQMKKLPRRRSKEKDLKDKNNQSSFSVSISDTGCASKQCAASGLRQKLMQQQQQQQQQQQNQKYLKNKQNYQYQDDFGGKKRRMEVISEEQEELGSDDEEFNTYSFDSEQGRKIQESCADFLSIVNDSVLDTVQKSVETILKEYFMHTLEKIECLCAQMVRNDCLMSKMYLDIMDKISQNNDKNQRQFKCLCQFLIDTRKMSPEEQPSKHSSGSSSDLEPTCIKACPTRNERRCPCGCKRESGPNFGKDAKNMTGSHHSNQTEEPTKLEIPSNAANNMATNSVRKRPSFEETAPNIDESKNKLSNNSSWNSNGGLNKSLSFTTDNSTGIVDTVITEEIRYFRNQSRIMPNSSSSAARAPLQPETQRANCCGPSDAQSTSKTQTCACPAQVTDSAGKHLNTEYSSETRSKATRSEKRGRGSELYFPASTRAPLKKKRSSR